MGVCSFKHASGVLSCSPFNFHLMPHSYQDMGIDSTFMIEQQAFEFLQEHNFDFNRLFYDSVGYLSFMNYERFLSMQQVRN